MSVRLLCAALLAASLTMCAAAEPFRYEPLRPDYWPTDGWRVAHPEDQGMDSAMLARIVNEVGVRKPGDSNESIIDSITVVRNGYIVADLYFNPLYPENSPHIIHSCTKSVMSLLIGIAIERGHIESVDVPVLEILGEAGVANLDARKRALTLRDLLTMQTGMRSRDAYLYQWEGLFEIMRSADWTRAALSVPMDVQPGTRFDYSNLSSFLLSAVLTRATNRDALSFAREYLFEPLGIREVRWDRSPEGVYVGWARMWLKPRDMAKIGLLYLQKGQWGERQIISQRWVDESTRAHASPGDYRYITDADGNPDYIVSGGSWIFTNLFRPFSEGYGYQLWLGEDGMYTALGHSGQFIIVAPRQNLVVVATGKLSGRDVFRPVALTEEHILPAVVPAGAEGSPVDSTARSALAARSRAPVLQPDPRDIPELNATARRISGIRFELEANPWRYSGFQLRFQPEQASAVFSYEARGRSYRIEVGLDNVFRFTNTNEERIAARGSWTAPDTFVIEYEIVGYSNVGRWVLKFEGQNLIVQETGVTGRYEYRGRASH